MGSKRVVGYQVVRVNWAPRIVREASIQRVMKETHGRWPKLLLPEWGTFYQKNSYSNRTLNAGSHIILN